MNHYLDKALVVRREGGLYRVVKSRFHAAGDLISKTVLDDVTQRTARGKVVVLPEGSVG